MPRFRVRTAIASHVSSPQAPSTERHTPFSAMAAAICIVHSIGPLHHSRCTLVAPLPVRAISSHHSASGPWLSSFDARLERGKGLTRPGPGLSSSFDARLERGKGLTRAGPGLRLLERPCISSIDASRGCRASSTHSKSSSRLGIGLTRPGPGLRLLERPCIMTALSGSVSDIELGGKNAVATHMGDIWISLMPENVDAPVAENTSEVDSNRLAGTFVGRGESGVDGAGDGASSVARSTSRLASVS